MTTTPQYPPGWYPDIYVQGQRRWWDGSQWAEHVQGDQPPKESPVHDSQIGPKRRPWTLGLFKSDVTRVNEALDELLVLVGKCEDAVAEAELLLRQGSWDGKFTKYWESHQRLEAMAARLETLALLEADEALRMLDENDLCVLAVQKQHEISELLDQIGKVHRHVDRHAGGLRPEQEEKWDLYVARMSAFWESITGEPLPAPQEHRPRNAIPERMRHEVWRRDQAHCVNCGTQERLEFDHIIPVSKGGSNTARNIELRCERCNRAKAAKV